MSKKSVLVTIGLVLLLVFSCSSACASGERWDYLGETHIDVSQDHNDLLVDRRDSPFRALRMRLSDDGDIYFLRLVVHYNDATSSEVVIHDRILSGSQTPTIDLPGEPRVIESVQLWYFKSAWTHPPKILLFGRR